MTRAVALPRARRRRKRPLSPLGKIALGLFMLACLSLSWNIIEMGTGVADSWDYAGACIDVLCASFWWPILRREWSKRDA